MLRLRAPSKDPKWRVARAPDVLESTRDVSTADDCHLVQRSRAPRRDVRLVRFVTGSSGASTLSDAIVLHYDDGDEHRSRLLDILCIDERRLVRRRPPDNPGRKRCHGQRGDEDQDDQQGTQADAAHGDASCYRQSGPHWGGYNRKVSVDDLKAELDRLEATNLKAKE